MERVEADDDSVSQASSKSLNIGFQEILHGNSHENSRIAGKIGESKQERRAGINQKEQLAVQTELAAATARAAALQQFDNSVKSRM